MTMPQPRPIRILGYVAIAFAALDLLSSIAGAHECGRLGRLLGFLSGLRPLTTAWIDSIVGMAVTVFVWGVLVFLPLSVCCHA